MFIGSILVFIGLLLLLVLVHEWGHFIAAKRAGCRVEEFGFGFPPRLLSFTWHDTIYSLNLLPIGGFVKIEGEDMDEVDPPPTSFASKSPSWRIIVLSAGVAMNLVLTYVLLSVQAGVGVPTLVTDTNQAQLTHHLTYIMAVSNNSPAAQAGLAELDRIVRINDISSPTIEQVQATTAASAGQRLILETERSGSHRTITLNPRLNPPPGEGAVGISLAATGLQKWPWWQAPLVGLQRTGEMFTSIISQFGQVAARLIKQGSLTNTLTGPIGIAVYTNEAAQMGLSYLLEFGALISLNLAIINILPLPALDGGRIVFVIVEKIFGKRLPNKIETITHTAGFVLLIGLMILITIKDVQRYL